MRLEQSKAVVIGNGCAGAECIIAMRDNGYEGDITMLTSSKWPIYNPMLTTYFAAGKIEFAQLFPYGSNEEFTKKYRVKIHGSSPVISVDAEKRWVVTDKGLEFQYNKCLVASGASPFLPHIPGIDSEKVFTMRTVEDALRLKSVMETKPRQVLVVGASMVGVKIMELCHQKGIEVCLVDMAPHLFPLAASPQCAAVLEERLKRQGIRFRFNARLGKIEETPGGIRACFSGSEASEEADMAVICIGVRPNLSFVNHEQLVVKKGILVNERMETNMPGLYAAGDVAQGNNLLTNQKQIIGLWANARYQGRTAGRNIAGKPDKYPGNIPHNITHFMGMDFISIGDVANYDYTEVKQHKNKYIQLFWKDGLLSSANLIDEFYSSGAVKYALIKGLKKQEKMKTGALPVAQDILIRELITEVMKG
ncbi:MAG TPA: FAD-dependent oxidoreductase [Thermoanaerobacterales bacterium]|nr:FAD-dependent oxidoreductase [Thermoanaerobacterales bacterium]